MRYLFNLFVFRFCTYIAAGLPVFRDSEDGPGEHPEEVHSGGSRHAIGGAERRGQLQLGLHGEKDRSQSSYTHTHSPATRKSRAVHRYTHTRARARCWGATLYLSYEIIVSRRRCARADTHTQLPLTPASRLLLRPTSSLLSTVSKQCSSHPKSLSLTHIHTHLHFFLKNPCVCFIATINAVLFCLFR